MGRLCGALQPLTARHTWKEPRDGRSEHLIELFVQGHISQRTLVDEMPQYAILTSHGPHGLPGYHVAVYLGDDAVLEYGPRGGVRECSLSTFFVHRAHADCRKCPDPMHDRLIRVMRPTHVADGVECRIRWATEHMRHDEYRLIFNNCEHFAHYVLYGKRASPQIRHAAWRTAGTIILLLALMSGALLARPHALT
jgi:hypothetical protein